MVGERKSTSSAQDAVIALAIAENAVKVLGERAFAPRINPISHKEKRFTAIEIAERAHQRVFSRYEREVIQKQKEGRIIH